MLIRALRGGTLAGMDAELPEPEGRVTGRGPAALAAPGVTRHAAPGVTRHAAPGVTRHAAEGRA